MIELPVGRPAHGPAQRAGGKMDIGVGKKQPIAAGNFDAALERMYFTQPAVRQSLHVQGANPPVACRQPIDDCTRPVGGAVVDQDKFEVGIVLPE